jgi:hypothetical protein
VDWNEYLMIVGLCATFAGGTLSLFYFPRRDRLTRQMGPVTTTAPLESMGELWSRVTLWGGAVLVQIGFIAHDLQRGATNESLAFPLAAGGLTVLVWGASLGRLSLRRHLRLQAEINREV